MTSYGKQITAPLDKAVLDKVAVKKKRAHAKDSDPASSFLRTYLSTKDATNLSVIKHPFILTKFKQKPKKKKQGGKHVVRLSGRKKKSLGLLKIDKKDLKFDDFKPINQCWTEYMSEYMKLPYCEKQGLTGYQHEAWEEFSSRLWKADFHGSLLKVVSSKCPVFVGIEGFVVLETKNTYKILGRDNITRCVPKQSCEFSVNVGAYQMTFLGKNMTIKPNERSNKKIKNFSFGEI